MHIHVIEKKVNIHIIEKMVNVHEIEKMINIKFCIHYKSIAIHQKLILKTQHHPEGIEPAIHRPPSNIDGNPFKID